MTATWQGPSLCNLLTQNGHRHKSFNTSAVVRRLIASCHNQPNAFGAKLLVPTSLLLTNWRTLLSNYSDKIVVDFLPYGWPINYTTSTLPASSLHNHPSASHFDSHVQAYIDTELAWNAIARPLEYLPFFDDFVCSPLQTVSKRGSPTWRVVMDLSFFQAAPSMTVYRTLSYSLNSTFTSRFTRTITAKKENTELINADRKPYKNDNLKYNKWLRKRAKITGKTILTRSVRQLRIQLSDWFTWTKNKTLY